MSQVRVYLVVAIFGLIAWSNTGRTNPEKDLFRAILNDDNEALVEAVDKGASIYRKLRRHENYVGLAVALQRPKALVTLLRLWGESSPVYDAKESPLHIAVRFNQRDAVLALIELGIDVDVRGEFGWTPLHLACDLGLVDIARVLLEKRADTEIQTGSGYFPIHLAAQARSPEMLLLLRDFGADVNSVTHEGRSAVHYAAAVGDETCIQILIGQIADPSGTDKFGNTARDFAHMLEGFDGVNRLDNISPRILSFISPRQHQIK